jgi:hypothetical protein
VFEKKYDLNLSIEPIETGEVTGEGRYDDDTNSEITITATPNDCYYFVHWKDMAGNEISKDPTYKFIITSDSQLIAVFARHQYVVTINANPTFMGRVEGGVSGIYSCNDVLNLEAISEDSEFYKFIQWEDDNENLISNENPLTYVIRDEIQIIAQFQTTGILEEDIYDISIVPNPTDKDFSIVFNNIDAQDILIELLDITGSKIIDIYEGFAPVGKQTYNVDNKKLSLSSGTYLVKFVIKNESFIRKVIVK